MTSVALPIRSLSSRAIIEEHATRDNFSRDLIEANTPVQLAMAAVRQIFYTNVVRWFPYTEQRRDSSFPICTLDQATRQGCPYCSCALATCPLCSVLAFFLTLLRAASYDNVITDLTCASLKAMIFDTWTRRRVSSVPAEERVSYYDAKSGQQMVLENHLGVKPIPLASADETIQYNRRLMEGSREAARPAIEARDMLIDVVQFTKHCAKEGSRKKRKQPTSKRKKKEPAAMPTLVVSPVPPPQPTPTPEGSSPALPSSGLETILLPATNSTLPISDPTFSQPLIPTPSASDMSAILQRLFAKRDESEEQSFFSTSSATIPLPPGVTRTDASTILLAKADEEVEVILRNPWFVDPAEFHRLSGSSADKANELVKSADPEGMPEVITKVKLLQDTNTQEGFFLRCVMAEALQLHLEHYKSAGDTSRTQTSWIPIVSQRWNICKALVELYLALGKCLKMAPRLRYLHVGMFKGWTNFKRLVWPLKERMQELKSSQTESNRFEELWG